MADLLTELVRPRFGEGGTWADTARAIWSSTPSPYQDAKSAASAAAADAEAVAAAARDAAARAAADAEATAAAARDAAAKRAESAAQTRNLVLGGLTVIAVGALATHAIRTRMIAS